MSWLEESIKEAVNKNVEKYRRIIIDELNKKEAPSMQVSYKGFTGELVKLERKETFDPSVYLTGRFEEKISVYDISIYESEKQVTHSFIDAKMEDVKFIGWNISFK